MSRRKRKQDGIYNKLQTQYRIVFINDESLEEVATFRLTIRKLYVLFSTLFVVIVGLTICVLLLTPLKYYIPGYGSNKTHMQVIRLKENVDSLSDLVTAQQNYEMNIRKVINGGYNGLSDTTKLSDKAITKEANKVIFPVGKK
ncbi:MAG: hypothetical protein ACTHJ0_10290 [Flavipsychrobacter sp.]